MPYILIIGSAHIDIIADFSQEQANFKDKIGKLQYSVGGTAYNIAVNLSNNYYKVALFTYLRKDSLVSPMVLQRIKDSKIDDRFLHFDEGLPESGFIAHRLGGRVVSAVSSMSIDSVRLDEGELAHAIEGACFVVADCNLSAVQLSLVTKHAAEKNKRIFVSGVSEGKVKRLSDVKVPRNNPHPFEVLAMNTGEARAILGNLVDQNGRETVREICKKSKSRYVVVTQGKDGFSVYFDAGDKRSFPAPAVSNLVSATGAGDALMAAVCAHAYENESFDWDACKANIDAYVTDVLGRDASTVGALARPSELRVLPRERVAAKQLSELQEFIGHLVHEKKDTRDWFTIVGGLAGIAGAIAAVISVL